MTVTDKDIFALQPKTRVYKHSVGNGLYVKVFPDGGKFWRIKYRFNGRETVYSVGAFPKVSLKNAIEANQFVKMMLLQGKNPNEEKKLAKALKPELAAPNLFHLSLSADGGITIKTEDKKLSLTPSETNALRSFLAIDTKSTGKL